MGVTNSLADSINKQASSHSFKGGIANLLPYISVLLFFLTVCLCTPSAIKTTTFILIILSVLLQILSFTPLRSRIKLREHSGLAVSALTAYVLVNGISTLYAKSGKFALSEFLKLAAAYCLSIIVLSLVSDKDDSKGYRIARLLAGYSAVAGIFSIDLLSTRLSLPLLEFLSKDYSGINGVEIGVRITSIFKNPNVFAGIVGLGVILSLGLVMSENNFWKRCVYLTLLYINSVSFLLAFSMGASGTVAIAFIICLFFERKEKRAGLLILMAETFVFALIAAFLISTTSFDAWNGLQVIPVLCVVFGSVLICLSDIFIGRRISKLFNEKLVPILIFVIMAAVLVFIIAAWNFTGSAAIESGKSLNRSVYPAPGDYVLDVVSDSDPHVRIESQNQQETMMHTDTLLFEGLASEAAFTVPDDSLVVYISFSASQNIVIKSAVCKGDSGEYDIPLDYRLLPNFISNRIQGLFANENAIQRTVFFSDGLKLFMKNPVLGRGIGGFENGIKSVQPFYYETKYAHNHYIQTLAETGFIGFIIFVALLTISAVVIWKGRKKHQLAPFLGGSLVFMASHAAVELVFSAYYYLPISFGIFVLIDVCCGENTKKQLKDGTAICAIAMLGIFSVLLGLNIQAADIVKKDASFPSFKKAAAMDQFEYCDYMLNYVVNSNGIGDSEISRQAEEYAAELEKYDSNTIPIYLADYYFTKGNGEHAVEMIEKYISYVASDSVAWNTSFELLAWHDNDTDEFRAWVKRVYDKMLEWNDNNIGEIVLSEKNQAYITRMISDD